MKQASPSTLRRLRRHQFHHLRPRRPLCLRAERGSLWITVDGEPEDIELDRGQSRLFEAGADIIVGAFRGDAVFSTTPMPRPPGWLQRLRAWLGAPSLAGQP